MSVVLGARMGAGAGLLAAALLLAAGPAAAAPFAARQNAKAEQASAGLVQPAGLLQSLQRRLGKSSQSLSFGQSLAGGQGSCTKVCVAWGQAQCVTYPCPQVCKRTEKVCS